MFIIYSKDNCSNCEKAKMSLYMKGKQFEVKKLDKDFSIQEYMDKFKVRSFPCVVNEATGDVFKSFEELHLAL